MDTSVVILLVYFLVFLPLMLMRPMWPFRLKRSVQASPDAVWNLISDIDNATFTMPNIETLDVQRDPDDPNLLHCTAHLKRRKRPFKYTARLIESKPGKVQAWEYMNPEQTKRFGSSEHRLSPDRQGTTIEFTARTRVFGIVGIIFSRSIYRRHLSQLEAMSEWA